MHNCHCAIPTVTVLQNLSTTTIGVSLLDNDGLTYPYIYRGSVQNTKIRIGGEEISNLWAVKRFISKYTRSVTRCQKKNPKKTKIKKQTNKTKKHAYIANRTIASLNNNLAIIIKLLYSAHL